MTSTEHPVGQHRGRLAVKLGARATLTAAVVALLGALILSGCARDTGPASPTTPVPAGSSTRSPIPSTSAGTPTAASSSPKPLGVNATPPAAARATTEQGAVEFATWYAIELSRSEVTGDSTTIRAYATRSCSLCVRYANLVDEDRAEGRHLARIASSVTGASLRHAEDGSPVVTVSVQDAKTPFLDKAGKVVNSHPRTRFTLEVHLTPGAGEWRVNEIV